MQIFRAFDTFYPSTNPPCLMMIREGKNETKEECGLSDQLHKADVETQMRQVRKLTKLKKLLGTLKRKDLKENFLKPALQVIQFETKLAEITTPASKMRDGENRSDICFVMNIKYLIHLAKKIAKTVLFFYHQIQQLHHWKATRGGQILQLDLIFPSSV